ncbi:MAG: hypothetical protein IPG04_30655 [Polyangiaceae bacterium]|nr:hypothetical protein [Polyangiaceae bacterium]
MTSHPTLSSTSTRGGLTAASLVVLLLGSMAFRCPGPEPTAAIGGFAEGGGGLLDGGGGLLEGGGGFSEGGFGGFGGFGEGGLGAFGGFGGALLGGGGAGGGCDVGTIDTDPFNCGACNRPCSTAGVEVPQCLGGVCISPCLGGLANLEQPLAPLPDDGCETDHRRVFVTSMPYLPATIGSILGADMICQQDALSAGLGGQWQAWISDGGSNAIDRFEFSTVPYRLLDGTEVATGTFDLTDGSILLPIDMDEFGNGAIFTEVWTGTNFDGTWAGGSFSDCVGWTSNDPMLEGLVGRTDSTDFGWSGIFTQFCNRDNVHLYCFER